MREKEELKSKLQKACAEAITDYEIAKNPEFNAAEIYLACFGSLQSGLASRGSDMDLALISPKSSPDPASSESEIPRLLEKTLLGLGYGARLLTKTRVPIIRFCEKPTPELLEALLENRAEWEREKDAPPKVNNKNKKTRDKNGTQGYAHQPEADKSIEEDATSDQSDKDPNSSYLQEPATSEEDQKQQEPKSNIMKERELVPPASKLNVAGKKTVYRADDELVSLYKLAIHEGWFEHTERLIIIRFIEAVKTHGADGDHEDLVNLRLQLQVFSPTNLLSFS